AEAQNFRLPLDCTAGACVVQNYADVDPGSAASDPACSHMTYDGHKGLDFRVRGGEARSGVPVVAIADGTVAAVRDGEIDRAHLSGNGPVGEDRMCGNGAIIEHAEGWSSQVCH